MFKNIVEEVNYFEQKNIAHFADFDYSCFYNQRHFS
jgi:hypothetical protein